MGDDTTRSVQIIFSKDSFRDIIQFGRSNNMDPNQTPFSPEFFGPDLVPYSLQRLSAGDSSWKIIKMHSYDSKFLNKGCLESSFYDIFCT